MSDVYQIASTCTFRVLSAGGVEATPAQHERRVFSRLQWQLIAEFTEPRGAVEVYEAADAELSLEELTGLLDVWVAAGVLEVVRDRPVAAVDEPSLASTLRQDVFGDAALTTQVGAALRAGRLIVIPDAFPHDFALEVWAALSAHTDWHPFETTSHSPGFHFSHHNIDEPIPDPVRRAMALFGTRATKSFAESLSGSPCSGGLSITASWYQPGDFSLPHTDAAATRTVAFVWHLARDWDDVWGGQLVWCPTGAAVYPRFNSLSIFNVSGTSLHFVAAVSKRALGKRLGINGWWHRPPQPAAPREPRPPGAPSPHVVSTYGPPLEHLGGVIVV